ncbi:MAG: hypothetical protein J2P38_05090, partial [Candidatus Dormibacteraeota bacterium]|nr:hypothetical protein [Candidatus Dormibacteraeota bacterium]
MSRTLPPSAGLRLPVRILARRRLIAQVGLVLVALLGAEVATIPFLADGLVPLHVGLGLGALPAVGVKLVTTGERTFRYYRRDPEERVEGPPDDLLRITAVVLVLSTLVLFLSGVVLWLLGIGVGSRILAGPAWILIHELSFIAFAFAAVVHALSYASRAVRWARDDWGP